MGAFLLKQGFVEMYSYLRIKSQLDVTCYFIVFLICSTCFGHSNTRKML